MPEDQDGQQITVAELLKRMGAEQPTPAAGRRHRRADEDGGVSVSELTGEIPRITDDTVLDSRAGRRRAREAEEKVAAGDSAGSTTTPAPAAKDPTPGPDAKAPTPAPAAKTLKPGPDAKASTPTRASKAAELSGTHTSSDQSQDLPQAQVASPRQQPTPRAAPAAAPASDPATGRDVPDETAGSGRKRGLRGLFGRTRKDTSAPTPRGESTDGPGATGVAGLAGAGAAVTTSRTGSADAPASKDAPPADLFATRPTPMRARGASVADKPADKPAASAAVTPVEKPAVTPSAGPAVRPADKPAVTPSATPAEKPAAKPAATPAVTPVEKSAVTPAEKQTDKPVEAPAGKSSVAPAEKSTETPTAWGAPSGRGSTVHRRSDEHLSTEHSDSPSSGRGGIGAAGAAAGAAGVGAAAATNAASPTSAASPTGATTSTSSASPTGAASPVVATSSTSTASPAGPTSVDGADSDRLADRTGAPEVEPTDDGVLEPTDDAAPAERSSAAQWAVLVAQVLASAVAGAALFIGFQLLWLDLPWVAMALAIVVIVGLVAMVRVLRRSNDLVSITLAIIVGLGVTCGPLLLRLVT